MSAILHLLLWILATAALMLATYWLVRLLEHLRLRRLPPEERAASLARQARAIERERVRGGGSP
ncbi:hypothetical protein [Salinarimonas ramus]|uniref:Uncharacterized protein n=1 Tax=Salinarimonas ramus TaxID=690164 RepID=A0A917Q438_9HYPH|nr:hypothetical protein [Salinarimonas ramus]GGK18702.1 hypothetical protein GCM10011322_01770 [Salinarimonas ramus]